jgi:hypothetical protein
MERLNQSMDDDEDLVGFGNQLNNRLNHKQQ